MPAQVDRVIISDERFSFYLRTQAHISALRDMVAPFVDGFEIVAYLRRQDSVLASRYSEMLRVGEVGEPDHRRDNFERLQDYDYRWLLDNWASVFGEAAMRPRIYERGSAKFFDSVGDFIEVCSLQLAAEKAALAVEANPSMNFAGQEVLRQVGRLLQEQTRSASVGGPLWRRISDTVTEILPGKGWLPTREEAAAFMQRFEEGNEDVRRRFFPGKASLFADESESYPVEEMRMDDRARFEAACTAILAIATRGFK